MLEELVRQARHDHALYSQAVKENKPLSVILYWAKEKRNSEEAIAEITKWSRTKLIDVITNGANF
jgi:16S rRNA G1207 methylase RsmC